MDSIFSPLSLNKTRKIFKKNFWQHRIQTFGDQLNVTCYFQFFSSALFLRFVKFTAQRARKEIEN
jgi:hypothetical protein